MLFVENPSLDPYFNIATEEYLLKHLDVEVIMVWRSKPSIVVGKHQNTLAEINLPYVKKHQIPVLRRLSGGGTVFHDPGNINFTFIKKAPKEKLIDFRAHTKPVIDFLQSLNLDARFQGKNDLRVDGLKISGNAEHVYKDKVLHHGTLLFDANLQSLNEAIKSREENFQSKAVKSVRSTVANISSLLPRKMDRETFMSLLKSFLLERFSSCELYTLSTQDVKSIEKIKQEKYTSWDWNYGWSPVYVFSHQKIINNTPVSVTLKVKKGVILSAHISENNQSINDSHPLAESLQGVEHHPDKVSNLLSEMNFQQYNQLTDKWMLLELFF